MLRMFTAKALKPAQVAQAFPLIQSVMPEVTLDRWSSFAGRLSKPLSPKNGRAIGIMTVQSEQGYIHGLFSYAVEADLLHDRVLSINNFVALSLVEREIVAEALFSAMDDIAHELRCRAIHLHLPEEMGAERQGCHWLRRLFAEDGHQIEGLRLCKQVTAIQ